MIVGPLLAVLCAAILWGVLVRSGQTREKSAFPAIIMGGYALRLCIQFVIRDLRLFSHVGHEGGGGDAVNYEEYAKLIARVWEANGVHYISAEDGFNVGATSLPQNLFAYIIYVNGGEATRLGCTAVIALAAGLTALNIYLLAVTFGAETKNALLVASIFYLQPAFLFYTSDLYKDGLVLCIAFGALGSALRLSFRISLTHIVICIASLFALWYVRFYLIFVTIAPLLVGIAGLGSKKLSRPLVAAIVIGVTGLALAAFTDILQIATERAAETFAQATSTNSIMGNAKGATGSGVIFDDGGSPYGALPAKLAYTLVSPFPWAGGSLGFQLGKLDGFLWYFILYRAIRATRHADRRLVLMLATFIIPCTLMYAMTMANVGLIVRQRLVIVAATSILAALYSPKKVEKRAMQATGRRPPRRLPSRKAA